MRISAFNCGDGGANCIGTPRDHRHLRPGRSSHAMRPGKGITPVAHKEFLSNVAVFAGACKRHSDFITNMGSLSTI